MVYAFAVATLIIGIIAGFLFQRTGQCFIGAYRDLYLFKDTHLLKGVVGFFIGALIGYIILKIMAEPFTAANFPWVLYNTLAAIPGSIVKAKDLLSILIVAIVGGFGIGFFSTAMGGCPMRNHVMAAEGNLSSIAYVIGFWVGIPLIYLIINALGI
ncbi:MAG: hypothetical protein QW158_04040 [Nitrososphaerales archaeon]